MKSLDYTSRRRTETISPLSRSIIGAHTEVFSPNYCGEHYCMLMKLK